MHMHSSSSYVPCIFFSGFLSWSHAGEMSTTMNIHLLYHLVDCVGNWGPLWSYSCFVYETMNGHIKKLFHGSRDMTKQVLHLHCNPCMIVAIKISHYSVCRWHSVTSPFKHYLTCSQGYRIPLHEFLLQWTLCLERNGMYSIAEV